jgi:N-acetylglucosaminyldiphosphoundecaprenol N-acetyl-beta-D-mannosaminyltransferase
MEIGGNRSGGPSAVARRSVALVHGLPIDRLTSSEAVDRVEQLVDASRAVGRPHRVATVNLDFVTRASRSPELLHLLQGFDLLLADGMPLVWASRLQGRPAPERVTGADLVGPLAQRIAARGFRLGLLGGDPGVAAAAGAALLARTPGLDVRVWECPWIDDVESMDRGLLDDVAAARPDVLLVALGHPKQEWWSARWAGEVGAGVTIGVGATLDFLAGRRRRAPRWMQCLGLEWLHRVAQEPRRLGPRYAADGSRLDVLRPRFGRPTASRATPEQTRRDDDLLVVSPIGRLALPEDLGDASRVLVDLTNVPRVGAGEVAELVSLAVTCRDAGGEFRLVRPTRSVRRTLRALHVDDLLVAPDPVVHPAQVG